MDINIIYRAIFLMVFLSSIAISGYYRKRARSVGEVIPRRAEGLSILLLRMAAALIIAASFFAYVFAPGILAWSDWGLPVWLRSTAAGIALLCLPVIRWVLVSIGSNISETILTKSTHHLVMQGPYHWIRHPLYAVALLELLSLAILASSWFLFLFSCIAVIVFRFLVIPKEEANLIKLFGEEYRQYKKRTGALIPRLWS